MYYVHMDISCINSLLLSISLDLSIIHGSIDNIPWTPLFILITYLWNENSQAWLGLLEAKVGFSIVFSPRVFEYHFDILNS